MKTNKSSNRIRVKISRCLNIGSVLVNFPNYHYIRDMIVELRSDTFTKPSPGMLDAMASAETGDDVFGEDPSVNKLENMTAELFGMKAALYCPTGTMSNQVAIKVHTQPGDEVICVHSSHVFLGEPVRRS